MALIACTASATTQGGHILGHDFNWNRFLDTQAGDNDGVMSLDEVIHALNQVDGQGEWDWLRVAYQGNPGGWIHDPVILSSIVHALADTDNSGYVDRHELIKLSGETGADNYIIDEIIA